VQLRREQLVDPEVDLRAAAGKLDGERVPPVDQGLGARLGTDLQLQDLREIRVMGPDPQLEEAPVLAAVHGQAAAAAHPAEGEPAFRLQRVEAVGKARYAAAMHRRRIDRVERKGLHFDPRELEAW